MYLVKGVCPEKHVQMFMPTEASDTPVFCDVCEMKYPSVEWLWYQPVNYKDEMSHLKG